MKLRVLRANSSPLTLSVKRGTARAAAAEARMEAGRVGILRINSFGDGEANEVKARLQDLIKQGAQKIVLDYARHCRRLIKRSRDRRKPLYQRRRDRTDYRP